MSDTLLIIDGQVANPVQLSHDALANMLDEHQIADVSQFDAKRRGRAVRLSSLLALAAADPQATHLGLHGTRDNFHASIPLDEVRDRAFVIYSLDGQPLPLEAGGPYRFFIPDHAACHAEEIDECANVKYLDRIELTIGRGFDNRPKDDEEHARLHDEQTR